MSDFGIPQRSEDVKEQVEILYNHVSMMGKNLDFLLSNLDFENLSSSLSNQITIATSKGSIFTSQPVTPYYVGDIWIDSDRIRKCTASRESGSYTASDWIIQTGVIVLTTGAQSITEKTLSSCTISACAITNPDTIYKQSSHDYQGGSTAWTLASGEEKAETLVISNSGAATQIIAPAAAGRRYRVINNTGYATTIKKSGGTGATVGAGKKAEVEYIGGDYQLVTPEV